MVSPLSLLIFLLPLVTGGKVTSDPTVKNAPKVIKFPEIHLSDQAKNNHTRVFGGSMARDGQFPYMVLVSTNMGGGAVSRCSAALISDDLVLLAAHCFQLGSRTNAADVIAVAGKVDFEEYLNERSLYNWNQDVPEGRLNGVQERRGLKIIIHPNYSNEIYVHDLALLQVTRPFVMSQNVQKIQFSTEKLSDVPCIIAGWGLTESATRSYKLVFANHVRTLSVGEGCQYKKSGDFYCLIKSTSGICQGDSGSPLVCDNKVWGVASHYLSYTTAAECGDDEEEYYADLSQNAEFLKEAASVEEKSSVGEKPESALGKGNAVRADFLVALMILAVFHLCS